MKSQKPPSAADFVHLHNHTQYSLLDGLTKIPQLIEHVKEKGMKAVAVTDHGTMSGTIEFYKTAKAAGVKPIIGIETYVAQRSHKDKDPVKDKNPFHLTLLAKDKTGYQNLMSLSTLANLEGFYYRPRIDHELLKKYNEGLIVLSGCIGGEVGDALRQGQYEQAKEVAQWYKKIFGDRYYLEVQDHGHIDHPAKWQEQVEVTEQTLRLMKELDIPGVLTCDAHYLKHEDQEAHEVLLCVQTGSYLADQNRMSLKDFDLFVTDPKDIIKRWGKEHPELITNSRKIADMCDVEIELGKILIPKFSVPRGETERSYLEKQVFRGLAWRYGFASEKKADKLDAKSAAKLLPPEIKQRADYELQVIEKMGFNGYFLIIADFVNWGKEQGIVFGPGRGSAAGSIIAYALKITELDPLEYDLLFERFLNPDRISMPDIDIDIQDSRRDEVIQYCIDKYGTDKVANIVTFGRMAARNAVRDVARVLQVPYAEADRLAKMLPPPVQGRHIPLSQSLKSSTDLKNEYKNEQSKRVFDLAVQLEGTIRSHGVHAAGVVIAPDDIVAFAPLEMAQKGVIATQYSMGPIEDLGLLKIDFLGLSNLTIIKNTLRIIKKVYGKEVDINTVPLDDKKTFELLQRGETTGVFQFESAGMKRYLKELKPTVFDDIIAMGALYRPGPLTAGLTQRFINRKNGLEPISYEHESMRSALESTHGVLVYQEQVMRIAQDMCGFTGGEADTLRKAVGKKQRETMAKMKDKIIKGAVQNNVDKKIAEKFWKDVEGFADYAFNKSHAACYGMISYQTAYLKAHYPTAFMAALMTSDFDNSDRLAIEINECKNLGLTVLQPDVNESFVEFAVVPSTNQVRFGMAAIKNVGVGAVEEILRARETDGKFASFEDFLKRVNTRVVNKKTLESLIKSGAFDNFYSRNALLGNIEVILAFSARLQKESVAGQTDLFGETDDVAGLTTPKLTLSNEVAELSQADQLQWERELLGVYLSQHPLDQHEAYLKKQTLPLSQLNTQRDGSSVNVGGVIINAKEITTKNGQRMAFVALADSSGEAELVIFPNIYQKTSDIWQRDKVIVAKGKATSRNSNGASGGEIKVLVETAKLVDDDLARQDPAQETASTDYGTFSQAIVPKVYIRLEDGQDHDTLLSLKDAIDSFKGDSEVVLVLGSNKQVIKLPMKMHGSDEAMSSLYSVVGKENVRLQ